MTKTTTKAAQNGAAPKTTLAVFKRQELVDVVNERLADLTGGMELMIPENYSVPNAVAAWWLRLNRPVEFGKNKGKMIIEVVTKESVVTATLDMIVMGLDPAMDQCYPVPYGDRLICQVGYFGRASMFRRVFPDAKLPRTVVVYDGDEFDFGYEAGELIVRQHVPGPHHQEDGHEKGAYCVVEFGDGRRDITWMPIEQIRKAWKQGAADGESPAHVKFPGEMAKKTVLSRALKLAIKSSGHSHLVHAAERQELLTAEVSMEAEVDELANRKQIDIGDDLPGDDPEPSGEDVDAEDAAEGDDQEQGADTGAMDPPAERFADMVERHGMNPTDAKKLLAQIYGIEDLRKITNDMFDQQCDNEQAFVGMYSKRFGLLKKEAQEVEPGW